VSRRLKTAVAVLVVAALLQATGVRQLLELSPASYWAIAVTLAGIAAVFLSRPGRGRAAGSGPFHVPGDEFVCDNCKYNDARYCSRSERPNAVDCPDYRSR